MSVTESLMTAERFLAAPTFPQYLETVAKHRELWHALARRARVEEELVARARAVPGAWRAVALTEDWCGDAINTLPLFDRLADAAPGLELRVLPRDENLDIMDAHLTNGVSRSIPVVILYDAQFRERGWWGPRPAPLQRWVTAEGRSLDGDARYREIRRYYARDKGRTTLAEFVTLWERCVAG